MPLDPNTLFPRWLQEFRRFQSMKSGIFLYGNVYDCYYFPVNFKEAQAKTDLKWAKFTSVPQLLGKYLQSDGYELICRYDVVDLLQVYSPPTAEDGEKKEKPIGRDELLPFLTKQFPEAKQIFGARDIGRIESNLSDTLTLFRLLCRNREKLFAGIINFSSRFSTNPNSLTEDEARRFIKLTKTAAESRMFPDKNGKRNIIILICDKLSDIPTWMLLRNPLTHGIDLAKPDMDERKRFFEIQSTLFFQPESVEEKTAKKFADLTDGFTNTEMENLITLSHQENIPVGNCRNLVDLYKYGVKENFWEKLDNERVNNAETELGRRVFGQDEAIRKSVDIIRRAKLGLHNIDQTRHKSKPKGVLFFAGPTGVGKTELAKSLAELIFSSEDAIIRMDMSEYNDSNSDVKMIGAPPGYVGYEEGGQLTRRIREKPFSIVLFDEIEKAHPVVFDKFLQILDDGRLTDGKGETVYFSEALIIFTSNLGIYRRDETGRRIPNVNYNDPADEVAGKIMNEIKNFFNFQLNRPEILNRFGDNFVVFDFIRPPVDRMILEKNLSTIKSNLRKMKNCDFTYDEAFLQGFLKHHVADNLINGGRGIINRVETHIKNGLANFLFSVPEISGLSFRIFLDPEDGASVKFEKTG